MKNKKIVLAIIIVALVVLIGVCAILLPSLIKNHKINKITSEYLEVTEVYDSVIAEYADENHDEEHQNLRNDRHALFSCCKNGRPTGVALN